MKWRLLIVIAFMLMLLQLGCMPTAINQISSTPTTENPETILQTSEEPIQNDSLVTKYQNASTSNDTQREYKAVLLSECAVNIQTKYEIVIELYHDDEQGMDIKIRYPVIISDEYDLIKTINEKLFSASYRNDEELLLKPDNDCNFFLDIECKVLYSDNDVISVVYYQDYGKGYLCCCTIDLLTGKYVDAAKSVKESELKQKIENEEYTIILPFIQANDSLELQKSIRSHFAMEANEFYSEMKFFFEICSYSLCPDDSYRTQNGFGHIVEGRSFIGQSMIFLFED